MTSWNETLGDDAVARLGDALEKWEALEDEAASREVPEWLIELADEYPHLTPYVREMQKPMTTDLELELLDLADRVKAAREGQ